MRTKDKVAIGWCDPGQVDGLFAADIYNLAGSRKDRLGALVRNEGSGLLSRMRNELVRNFLNECDEPWLLMLDTDLTFPVAAFDELCATAHDKDRPVVSGLYFGAWRHDLWITPIPVVFHRAPDIQWVPVFDYPKQSIFEVDAAATGCLLVHRSVLERIRENAPENVGPDWCWFLDGPVGGRWVSEDLMFSERVKAAGFPIWCNSRVLLQHRKPVLVGEKQFDWLVSTLPADEEGSG